ncbi:MULTISPECIES: hypothetical protein [Saccharothrix]|nr:hypothetical protein [Saccharothrix sp. CB00851]
MGVRIASTTGSGASRGRQADLAYASLLIGVFLLLALAVRGLASR